MGGFNDRPELGEFGAKDLVDFLVFKSDRNRSFARGTIAQKKLDEQVINIRLEVSICLHSAIAAWSDVTLCNAL
jgi:hypothetical protein